MEQHLEAVINVFLPHYNERKKNVESKNLKFVHYTNAQAAMSIIESNEFWLKKTTRMNDYSETYHGFECLRSAYRDQKDSLIGALDGVFPNIVQEVEDLFNQWWDRIRYNAYIACFSEFNIAEPKCDLGKLSMWRAYGGNAGVALVLNSEPFFNESDAFKAMTAPVIYADDEKFKQIFLNLVVGIQSNIALLTSMSREEVKGWLYSAFLTLSLSVKHPGFEEENEWRIIYTGMEESKYLRKEIKSINGIPQNVYKIPLENIPQENVSGIDIPALLDRIIIGPCDNALDIIEAFDALLTKAGIPDVSQRIRYSNIPLRT